MKNVPLHRLQPKFIRLVDVLLDRKGVYKKTLAAEVGIQPSRLSALMTGKLTLSAIYLAPFIWGGMITVAEIYDGKAESDREKRFWAQMSVVQRQDLTELMLQCEEQGLNVHDVLLKEFLKTKAGKKS